MNRLFGRALLLFIAWFVTALTVAQDASLNYEKALQAYNAGENEEAFIHLKNALQEDPDLVSARLLLAQVRFNAGDIGGAEKESEEALLLGADINLVLPVYGHALILQEKIDELLEIEKVKDSFTPASQFEWALLKGQAYMVKGDPKQARSEFERAATLLPDDIRANNTLAAIYMQSGMEAEARALVEKTIILNPLNAKTWELRGELEFDGGHYEQALEYFLKGFELDPEDIRLQRALAQVYLQLDDKEKVKEYLDLILEQSEDDPAATLLSAILLIGGGDTELGDSMLTNLSSKLSTLEFVQEQSGDGMLFIQASAEYVRRNDATAISLFNAYLLRNKDDVAAIRLLADLYLRNGEFKQATELLGSNEDLVSGDLGLSIQLLDLFIQSKNFHRAQDLLKTLKKNGAGDNPYVVVLEGELLRLQGQSEAALTLLEGHSFGDKEPLSYGLLRGVLQLKLQKYPDAQDSAQRLLSAYPDSVAISNFATVTYLTVGKLDEAETYIARSIKLAPDNVDAKFNQAMLYKKRNNLEESRNTIKKIIEQHPNHTKSLLLMARILFLQQKYDEAIEWSDKVFAYDGYSNSAEELQLEVYSQMGDWKKAKSKVQRMVREDPRNTDYLVRLVDIAGKLKDKELEENTLRRLYPLWKKDPEKLRQLAALQLRAGHTEEARKCLQTALTLDEHSFGVQLDLARLDFTEGHHDKAENAVDALQKEFGKRTESAYLLGEIALARAQPEAAQKYFMSVFQLDKNNTDAIARLYELSVQGVGSQAFSDAMESSLKNSSLPPTSVKLLADVYLIQGKPARAAFYYEKLLELPLYAKSPDVLNNLANIYATQNLDKGLATAMKGLEATAEPSWALLDTVGWILAQQGENEKALSYLRKAYAKNSTDPEIRYHTGVTLLALDRTADAETELRAAIDSGKQFTGREEAERLLASLPEPTTEQ